ncbi:MAG: hypothetical protein WC120_04365 [Parcubacteria group bacterium]
MRKTKSILASALAIFTMAFFIPAQAQELVPPEQDTQAITVATVNIYDAQIAGQDQNNIKITFDLSNREQVQPDVRYAVQLTKQNQGQQIIMDEKIYPESLSLDENQTLKKEIEYLAPGYLTGEFQLMLIARNRNGMLLAINTAGTVKLQGDNQYVEIDPSSCYLKVEGEEADKRYTLDQGVDIKPEEKLIAACDLANRSSNSITFTPNFQTYWRTTFGEEVKTDQEDQSTLTLNPQEKKQTYFTLPKPQAPQAYDAVLELRTEQNQAISNRIAFHFVLRGPSATIQNLRLDKDYYQKGETAQTSFFWSGAADNFPDSRWGATDGGQLSADINIKNGQNQTCATLKKALDQEQPSVDYVLPINQDCPNPKISVSIKDEQGNILDQQEFSIKSQNAPDQAKPQSELVEPQAGTRSIGAIGYAVIIIIGLLVLSILAIVIKQRRGLSVVAFLVLAGGMFVAGGEGARADTFVVTTNDDWQVTYTVNLNKTVYSPGEAISYSWSSSFSGCSNRLSSLCELASLTTISGNPAPANLGSNSVVFRGTSEIWGGSPRRCIPFSADYSMSYTVVSPTPPAPSGLQGTCDSTGTNATVSWNPSVGATKYNIRYDKNSASWLYTGYCTSKSEVSIPTRRLVFSVPSADTLHTASKYEISLNSGFRGMTISASGSGGEEIELKSSNPRDRNLKTVPKNPSEFARLDLVSTTGSDSIYKKLVYTVAGHIEDDDKYEFNVPRANGAYKIKVQGYGFGQTVPVEKEISYTVAVTDPEDICTNGYASTSFAATAVPGNSNTAWVQACDSYSCSSSTYKSFSCTSSACTLPWGATIPSGSSVTTYNATQSCDCSAASQTSVCTNGTLSPLLGAYDEEKCIPIDSIVGGCGAADGQEFMSEPTSDLCSSGNPSAVSGTNDSWDWTCNGICSTVNVSCSADRSLDLNWKEVNPN